MSTLVEQDKSKKRAVEKDPDFDWTIYVQLYDDLKKFKTERSCYAHWLSHGKKEKRVASLKGICEKFGMKPDAFPSDFDWREYVRLNPDISNNVSNEWQAIFHYCRRGRKGNRPFKRGKQQSVVKAVDPTRLVQSEGLIEAQSDKVGVQPESFDWEFYIQNNNDLKISSQRGARRHWENHGKQEGRPGSVAQYYRQQKVDIKKLPKDFKVEEYLALHPILQEKGIEKRWVVTVHFLKHPNYAGGIYSFKGLGMQLERRKDYPKAIEAFEKAMKFSPDDVEIQGRLAKVLCASREWQRAASVYRKIYRANQISSWELYEISRELLESLRAQVDVSVAASISSAATFLSKTEAYNSSSVKKESGYAEKQLTDFSQRLDEMLEAQMSVSLELTSMQQAHKAINSVFNLSDFVAFSSYRSPAVSVIIPVYNKIDYTIRCLKSIVKNVSKSLQLEVIVVNDCSSDETKEYLQNVEGLVLVDNQENLGFIHSCNAGAKAAKGKYLYFLNNDTEVLPNAIESLVEVFETQENVGAVGSKLVYPSGALQEAGGIIWQDASGWNYGRNQNPHDPQYNFVRSVDYCSGASLLVKRETFEKLDGFEQEFAPAYYEDTDLCFAIRHQLGMEVIYQPASEIIHYEGVSSGTSTSSGIKRYQVVNAEKFKKKWASALKTNLVNEIGLEDAHRAARRFQGHSTILIIDSYLPCYDRDAGSRRMFQIVKIFKELGYHVIFLPNDMRATQPYASELQMMQVEVLYTCDGFGNSAVNQLKEKLPLIDVAWVCRPDLMKDYLTFLREKPDIKVIYDTIDLHYLRMKRQMELGLASDAEEKAMSWVDMQALELKMAMRADLTITVTHTEQEILQTQGVKAVEIVPTIHFPYAGKIPGFSQRSGLLFIGGYNHPPNVDAVEWLCNDIMPIVWKKIPNIHVTLLGSNPPEKVKSLASEQVSVPGYINDVTQYFLDSRVFVAPLRFGAGMKGKIGQSLEHSLPLVSTAIGIEGMNLVSGENAVEANTSEEFAKAVIRLYSDEAFWSEISKNSTDAIRPYSPQVVKQTIESFSESLSTHS